MAGIVLAAFFPNPWQLWLAGAAVAVCAGLCFGWFSNRRAGTGEGFLSARILRFTGVSLWLLIAGMLLGAVRYQVSLPDLKDTHAITRMRDDGLVYVVSGVLVKPPDVRDGYTNLWIACEKIRMKDAIHDEEVHGLLLVRTPRIEKWHYGDLVVVEGRVETPQDGDDFSYRAYLYHKGVYATMTSQAAAGMGVRKGNVFMRFIFLFREKALDEVYRLWHDPEASLIAGILLGVENGISARVASAFKATGTTHIIAISGFNITIIAGLLIGIFGRVMQRYWAAAAAIAGVLFYTLLVGADAAVVRAAIMSVFSLTAVQLGRRQHGLNSLAAVAGLMGLLDPHVLWDVGFQLSFAATLGLVLYAQPMQDWFVALVSRWFPVRLVKKIAGPVGEYFLFTLAAQATTLPVLAYHFKRLSLSSLLVNPLILPAQPPLMILGGVALLAGLVSHILGVVTAPLAWFFAGYTIRVVEAMAPLPGGVLVVGRVGIGLVFLYYAGLFAGTAWFGELKNKFIQWKQRSLYERLAIPVLVGLSVSAALLWRGVRTAPDGYLHLTLFDTGSSNALFIRTPTGHTLLIGGGSKTSLLSDALGRRLPFGQHALDVLLVPSANEQDIRALPGLVTRYLPKMVLWAGPLNANKPADRLRKVLKEQRLSVVRTRTGQALDFGDGVSLRILHAGRRGVVCLLKKGAFRAILPLGISMEDMQALEMGKPFGDISVYLLTDYGYAPANPPEWVGNLHPQVILLPVAADDPDGLPNPAALESVHGYSLLRTDLNGWIEIITDGEKMWIEAEKR